LALQASSVELALVLNLVRFRPPSYRPEEVRGLTFVRRMVR
jgi:hypothetical protein